MRSITIPAETIPVTEEADICVIGGSCTGLFAAVRAARLGAKVVLLEKHNRFGGAATAGLVCMWHSIFDITGERQIIGGLTFEMMERLEKRGAIGEFRKGGPHVPRIPFNSNELTLELDALAQEHPQIRTCFHTFYSRPVMNGDGTISAVIAENKSGRFAVAANFFIDASGDGLLCRAAGYPMRRAGNPQPPTACALLENYRKAGRIDLKELIEQNRSRYPDLPCGYSWGTAVPGSDDVYMLSATRILNCDCMDADAITQAEFESRRQIRALTSLLRETAPEAHISLQGLPSEIGIRESCHIVSAGPLRGKEMLAGTCYRDTIGAGTYPVDIHGNADDSISFLHLTGSRQYFRSRTLVREERWLPEGEFLPFYRIPLSCLIPGGAKNLIAAGRMLDADGDSFGAVRVMVNLNQCGEAAGVAACCALNSGKAITEIDGAAVRNELNRGGSLIPEA